MKNYMKAFITAVTALMLVSTAASKVSIEPGNIQPDKVSPGSSVSNQKFNLLIHELSLDGNTDNVYLIFPDDLAKNNSVGDQANGVNSNISVGSSVTSVNIDNDEVVEALKVGLQEDGEGNATGEVTFDVSVDYPAFNSTYSFEAKVEDSKTGTDTATIGTVTVGDGDQQQEDDTKDNQTQDNQTSDSTDNQTDSGTTGTTDSTSEETETTTSDTDKSNNQSGKENRTTVNSTETAENTTDKQVRPEPKTGHVTRPEKGVVKVGFGRVKEGEKAVFSTPGRDGGLKSVKITAGETANVSLTIRALPAYSVEGQPVYMTREIEVNTKVKQAEISFEVNRTWVERQEQEVVIKRQHNSEWQVLETEKTSEANRTVTYIATTPGFSKFAVTTFKEASHQTNTTEQQGSTDMTDGSKKTSPNIYLLGAIILALIIAFVYFYRRRP